MKEGCVTKKNGKYYYVVDLEREENNKRKLKWISGFNTREEAERYKINYLYDTYNYSYKSDNEMTVKDWMERWFRKYVERHEKLELSTKSGYKTNVDRHIIPALGKIPLNKLTAERIDDFYHKKMSGTDNDKPLSPTTVIYIHRVLNLALKTARKKGYIKMNPADDAETPTKVDFDATALDELELQNYLDALKYTPFYLPFLLAASRGLRRGEILGLRWGDVDLKNRLIHIKNTIVQVDKKIVFKGPKTTSGIRTIDIPQGAVDSLKQLRKKQAVISPMNLIFCNQDGSPLCPPSFSSNFAKTLKKHNLPHIRLHDLRHTFCSINIEKGVDFVHVSKTVGHKKPSFTVDYYGSHRKKVQYGLYHDYDINFK